MKSWDDGNILSSEYIIYCGDDDADDDVEYNECGEVEMSGVVALLEP